MVAGKAYEMHTRSRDQRLSGMAYICHRCEWARVGLRGEWQVWRCVGVNPGAWRDGVLYMDTLGNYWCCWCSGCARGLSAPRGPWLEWDLSPFR